MKTTSLILIAVVTFLLTSCSITSFYQVYKATPSDKLIIQDNSLVYEDDNCKVSYNLWGEGGNIGFCFFNKTDKNIYLNMEESFFVLNGISYNYYRNRVFTNSSTLGITTSKTAGVSKSVTGYNYLNLLQANRIEITSSAGLVTSSGYSTAYIEEKFICIPSKTSKIITEYSINESLIRDCDLFKYPSKKQIKTKSFSKKESPIVFSNRITYAIGRTDNIVKFENEFFVSEISNYPASEFLESKYDEYCGQKSSSKMMYFKDISPAKFYIRYIKGTDGWKH